MKNTFLAGVAAGALLTGISLASAQGMMERQPPAASGGASVEQQKAGGAGAQQKGRAGAEIKAEQPGAKSRAQAPDNMKAERTKPAPQAAQGSQKMDSKAQSAQPKSEPAKSGTSAQGEVKSGSSTAQGSDSAAGSGQAAAGAKVSLTTEQKTRIRETVIRSSSAPRVTKVNFSLTVGTVVPRTVRFAPLPTILVEIYPVWRGYDYFIVGDQIVIIEPRTLRIVAVLNV